MLQDQRDADQHEQDSGQLFDEILIHVTAALDVRKQAKQCEWDQEQDELYGIWRQTSQNAVQNHTECIVRDKYGADVCFE